ncbi:MAG TPA: TusE/DsrC/DsvC family sulfur relay protein, partial [Anaerolineae bacterium]
FLREYYRENELAPPIRLLCRETGLSLKVIYRLFPAGPARGACKIAGLPKPTGCA